MSKKSDNIQVKVTMKPKDHNKLLLVAEENHQTKADYIRSVLKIKIENAPALKVKKTYKMTDPNLMYQIVKIGVNLNQIAKHANIKKRVEREILTALVRIEKDLKQLL